MAELMRREPPPDAGLDRHLVSLEPGGAGRPGVPDSGSGDHAEQRADRQRGALGQPRPQCRPPPRVHPDLATIVLPMSDQNRPALFLQIGLDQRQRLIDPQPGPPQHNDQPVDAIAVPGMGSVAHDRDDLIDVGGSAVALTVVPRRPPDVKGRQRRRRAATAGSIEDLLSRGHGSLPWRAGRLPNQLYPPRAVPSSTRFMPSAVARNAIPITHYRILSNSS